MQIEFAVGAKAARLIGRENISDVDGALVELIKNAYDADATCVWVDFSLPFPDIPQQVSASLFMEHLTVEELARVRMFYEENAGNWVRKENLSDGQEEELRRILFSHNQIVVADNGSGMTKDIVTSAWMYIGTSDKEYNVVSPKGRIKTGAKGIGRFALDKLSRKSVMYTRSESEGTGEDGAAGNGSGTTVKWQMDWDQFVNARLLKDIKADMDEISISYEELVRTVSGNHFDQLKEHDWTTGTMVILTPVRESWGERLFQRVNSNLQSINPIGNADKFRVIVNNHFYPEYNFVTKEVAIADEDYDYRIKAGYDGDRILRIALLRNEVNIKRKTVTITAGDASTERKLSEFWEREAFQAEGYGRETYGQEIVFEKEVTELLPRDSLDKIRKVGAFEAELYFLRRDNNEYEIMKHVAVKKRKKLVSQFSGVKLYRDSFKVRPYGDEGTLADWLEMGSRAQRSPAAVSHPTGSWRVQPYQIIGMVKIGRETNPNLIDTANREGMVLNESYYIFVDLLQECLKIFEYDRQYVYREYARWRKGIEEELKSHISRVQEAAVRANAEKGRKAKEQERVDREERHQARVEENDMADGQEDMPTAEEMLDTVFEMMQKEEKEIRNRQMIQILSSSGIVINTFFHEFNAINTKFHVQASQLRSRVEYAMGGKPYTGLPAYNPYDRLDIVEKGDDLVASFLDVIMEGLRKANLKCEKASMKKLTCHILGKWKPLLEEKHITIDPTVFQEETSEFMYSIAMVDMYIILNNVLLNATWFLEQGHHPNRQVAVRFEEDEEYIYQYLENNGPPLSDKYKGNPDIIFEMGESSKGEEGTGLGLWAVKEAVERYDSTVNVLSEKTDGFGIRILWKKERSQ